MTKMEIETIEKTLCNALCTEVKVVRQEEDLFYVSTPFMHSDGDTYSIYLQPLLAGGFKITDLGSTFMHLSYDNEVAKFRKGTRRKIFQQILSAMDLQEDEGEFFIHTPADKLGINIFKFGQAVTQLHDLTFLNRIQAEHTFYEDLREKLYHYIPPERIHEDYRVPTLDNPDNYPIDFYIEGAITPLYLFGVPSRDKAMLTTIILQHLYVAKLNFRSLVVFRDSTDIPPRTLSHLMDAGGEMISSLEAADESFERKLR